MTAAPMTSATVLDDRVSLAPKGDEAQKTVIEHEYALQIERKR